MDVRKQEIINSILTRNVTRVIDQASLLKKLRAGRKLRIKLGADPTSPDLHLGHAVLLWKLREFQEAGHQIVFIIGDFTAMIGDPSGRSEARPVLPEKEIQKNAKTYFTQAGKILDIKKVEIYRNSSWLKKLSLGEWLKILKLFTVPQMLQREDFAKRLSEQRELWLHEIMYPLLQAYDSVIVNADVEVGGQDQLFNLLAGRHLQEKLGKVPQDILVTDYVIGLDGVKKMSKSLGNYIGIMEPPRDMMGKVMSIPDELIISYFNLTTKRAPADIADMERRLKRGENPRDLKLELAREIVALYYGPEKAERARAEFLRVFSRRELPRAMDERDIEPGSYEATALLLALGLAKSRAEARRLIEQGAMDVTLLRGEMTRVQDPRALVSISRGTVVRLGKTRFIKIGNK